MRELSDFQASQTQSTKTLHYYGVLYYYYFFFYHRNFYLFLTPLYKIPNKPVNSGNTKNFLDDSAIPILCVCVFLCVFFSLFSSIAQRF